MSVQFVNVDPKTGKFWNASQTQQQILDMAAQKRDPLMDEFVSELEKLWIRTGVRDVCKRCVAGEFLYMGKNGCCGGCPNVSTQGCIAKPMRCATFLCSTGHMYDKLLTLPGLDKLRWEMDKILSFAFNGTQWDQKTGQLNYSDNIYRGAYDPPGNNISRCRVVRCPDYGCRCLHSQSCIRTDSLRAQVT